MDINFINIPIWKCRDADSVKYKFFSSRSYFLFVSHVVNLWTYSLSDWNVIRQCKRFVLLTCLWIFWNFFAESCFYMMYSTLFLVIFPVLYQCSASSGVISLCHHVVQSGSVVRSVVALQVCLDFIKYWYYRLQLIIKNYKQIHISIFEKQTEINFPTLLIDNSKIVSILKIVMEICLKCFKSEICPKSYFLEIFPKIHLREILKSYLLELILEKVSHVENLFFENFLYKSYCLKEIYLRMYSLSQKVSYILLPNINRYNYKNFVQTYLAKIHITRHKIYIVNIYITHSSLGKNIRSNIVQISNTCINFLLFFLKKYFYSLSIFQTLLVSY